jgi:hypothetical protein
MGLIEKLNRAARESRVPTSRTEDAGYSETAASIQRRAEATPKRAPGKRRPLHRGPKSAGIPPLKEPKLPPGRSAILILCTRDRRPYWHVFKKAPSTTLGWEWERHLPAVPAKPREKAPITATNHAEISPDENDLHIGGRYWPGWYCPGCNQMQKQKPNGYAHFRCCPCGANFCLGPGRDQDRNPTCPNCGTERTYEGGLSKDPISGVHEAEQSPGGGQYLSGPGRKQIG